MVILLFLQSGKEKNSVYVGNGSFVENKEFKVESENRGSFYMEYDQTSLLVRSNCPIKIQAEEWDVERTFLFDWRRESL